MIEKHKENGTASGRVLLIPARVQETSGKDLFFLFSTTQVEEVRQEIALYPVPFSPPHVAGITNWMGRILPILQLENCFGLDVAPSPVAKRFVVIHCATPDNRSPGLLRCVLPAPRQIRFLGLPIPCEPVEPAGRVPAGGSLLKGLYQWKEGVILAADMGRILLGQGKS